MQKLFQIVFSGLLLALASPAANAAVCASDRDLDACLTSGDPVASCKQALDRNKNDASVRLSLCEAYVGKGELDKAHAVVQQGIDLCGRRRCGDLKLAESNVRERQQRVAQQEAAPAETDSRDRAYCIGPIANARSMEACKRLLEANKNDVAIAEGLAEKLMKTNKPAQALLVLTDIANLTTSGRSVLAQAKQAHEANVQRCLQGSDIAVCDTALLVGGSAEYEIHRKRGELLSAAGKSADALQALRQSVELEANDRATATAIVGLNAADFGGSNSAYFEALVWAERLLENRSGERAALLKLVAVKPDNQTAKARLLALQPPKPVIQETITKSEAVTVAPVPVAPNPVAKMEAIPQPERTIAAVVPAVQSAPQSAQISSRSTTLYINAMDNDGRSH